MIHSNIITGKDVEVSEGCSLNNVQLGDGVSIGDHCTIFGSAKNVLKIGGGAVIGRRTILNGFAAQLKIGRRCSIGAMCHFIVDTGPTASETMQKRYSIREEPITIGDDCVIGSGTMVIAGSVIGEGSFIHPKSFVNSEIPPYSIAAGCPAKVIGKVLH